MITRDPQAFVAAWQQLPAQGPASMRAALLVDAAAFAVSAASATDNAYMDTQVIVDRARAGQQLDAVASALRRLGVPVITVPGHAGQPDGVYPNNVYATVPGRLVVGHMRHAHRQLEAARADVRDLLTGLGRYTLHDLSTQPGVGELTGVLAIDRRRGAAVCGLSSRVDDAGLQAMHEALALPLTLATPLVAGEYHINLVLAVLGGDAAVVWAEGFVDPAVPEAIEACWPGRVLRLSTDEKNAFAGNCLAVTPGDVMMSATSWRALKASSRTWFERCGYRVHPVEVDELEKGGGSLRCLVAELY